MEFLTYEQYRQKKQEQQPSGNLGFLTYEQYQDQKQNGLDGSGRSGSGFLTYEQYRRKKDAGKEEMRQRYREASGMELLRSDFSDYMNHTGSYLSNRQQAGTAVKTHKLLEETHKWQDNLQKERKYFQDNADYFTQAELNAYQGELDFYGQMVASYEQELNSGLTAELSVRPTTVIREDSASGGVPQVPNRDKQAEGRAIRPTRTLEGQSLSNGTLQGTQKKAETLWDMAVQQQARYAEYEQRYQSGENWSALSAQNSDEREFYDYLWGRTFYDMENDENYDQIVEKGKERYLEEEKAYNEELEPDSIADWLAIAFMGSGSGDDFTRNNDAYQNALYTQDYLTAEQLAARKRHPVYISIGLLTEEEQNNYYYLVGAEKDDIAIAYANEIVTKDSREELDKIRQWAGTNTGTRFLASVASVAGTMLSPALLMEMSLAERRKAMTGLDENSFLGLGAAKDALRSGAATGLAEKGLFNTGLLAGSVDIPLLGEKSMGDLYSLGMSMVDSYVAGAIFGASGASLVLGSSAAVSAYYDALEKDASIEQAVLQAMAQGAAECVFEYLSLDAIFGDTLEGVKNSVLKALAQGGIEASEELATSLSNLITEQWIMGAKSEYNLLIEDYLSHGQTEEQAKKSAKMDVLGGLLSDALGGLISGAGMSGINSGFSKITENSFVQKVQADKSSFDWYAAKCAAQITETDSAKTVEKKLRTWYRNGAQYTLAQLQEASNAYTAAQQADAATAEQTAEETAHDGALPDWDAYEQENAERRFTATDTDQLIDQTEDFKLWRDNQYYTAQEYTEEELSREIEKWVSVRDDTAQDAKTREIAQYYLDALEVVQQERTNENKSGGTEHGTGEISYDGGQRDEGLGAGGTVGTMAEGTGGSIAGSEKSTQTVDLGNLKANAENQSTREIGIADGSDSKTLRVLSADQIASSEQLTRIQNDAQEHGARTVFYTGKMEILNRSTGKYTAVEGLFRTEEDGSATYYIKTDKHSRNAEQIYQHEKFHALVTANPGLLVDLVELLETQYGAQEIAALVNSYAEAYDGIYGRYSESMTVDEQEELIQQYMEEVLADAYAQIRRGNRNIKSARAVLESQTSELQTAQENLRGLRNQNAPPMQRFSQNTGQERSDGDILEKERKDALIYGFNGEIHTGKFQLSRKEYATLRAAIKSGNGILSAEMYCGTVNTADYNYFFDFFADGSVEIISRVSAEDQNIHTDINREVENEYSREIHRRGNHGNPEALTADDRSRGGIKNESNAFNTSEQQRNENTHDSLSGAESERFAGRDRTGSDSDREGGGLESSHSQAKQRFSIQEIQGEKGDYGEGVLLDTDLFDGIHPRNWGKKLREFVYNNLAGSELTMYDENGNPEAVFIANEKDRVQKLSAKNNHRVIDKLARNSGDNIRSLATVHLSEALLTSKNETSTDEHSHQWMDENGWRYRTVYLQDVSGNIFTATLNIANGRNGGILYDINNIRKVDNAKRETTGGVVPSAVSGGARSTSHSFSSDSSIQQGQKNVKQKFSLDEDIAALDEAYSRRMAEADEAQETARDDSDAAAEKKRQKAEAKSISQLKNGIKSAQQAIATQTAAKVALRNAGQLTADVKTVIDNKIEDIRQTIRIEQAALKQKQAEQEKAEKEKKQAEFEKQTAEQKARTAQKELRQDLLNLFSVKEGRRSETAQAIDAISDELLRSGRVTHENRKALLEALYENGEGLAEPEEYYSEIRAHLNKGRIYVSDSVRAEFGDDWNTIRKQAFASRIYLTKNITDIGIDIWTQELAEVFGGRFDATADLKTQLETILELAEEGRTERVTIAEMMQRNSNDYGWSVEEQMEQLEQKVDHMLETFAQKADLEIRLRKQSVKEILAEHEYFRNKLQRQRQERAERSERADVMKNIRKLAKMRRKTTPEYKRQINEVLKGIDEVARRVSDRGIEDLQELQRLYCEARDAEGENFLKNDYVEDRIEKLNKIQLDDLDIAKVRELGNVVSSIVNSIQNSKKLLADQQNRMIDEAAREVNREIAESEGSNDGMWHQYFLNHLDGKRIFGKLSGWVDGTFEQLGKNLSAGQEREMHFQLNASRIFESFLAKKKNRKWIKKSHGENAEWIKLEVPDAVEIRRGHIDAKTKTIEITPMMRLALLMHSKNEDNLRHIKTGGIKIPDKALYSKGKIRQAYDKGEIVKMEPSTVRAIVKQCSRQEATFATLLEKYFGGLSKNAINEVSMQLDGFERAGERFYYPIESVKDFLANIDGAQSRDMSVQAIGSIANERVKAGNPIVLEDATSTLMRQIGNTAKYYGYAIPIRDLNAVLSATFHEKENAFSGSVKDTLSKKWGSSSIDYLNKLMADVQIPKQSTDIASRFAEKLRGNYARAVIAFNLSSLLKQMTSYPVALPYLKADALTHGLRKVQKSELAALEKYSAVYWYRNLGNSTTELGDVTSKQGIEDKLPFLFKLTQAMDSFTTRRLLAASEYRVQKDMKLRPGTQEEIDAGTDRYWTEVAKLFNDVVLKTQSNSSQMERPQITRANNSNISRWYTMFKTDAFQQYGMLVEASGRLKSAEKAYRNNATAENKAKLKETRKFMARTVVGTLTGQLSCGLITSLLKIARFDDDEFRNEDGELDVGKLAEYLAWSTVEGYCGFLIGGEILYSVLDASIDELTGEGGRWWDIEATGLSTINDIAESIIDLAGKMKDGSLWEGRGWIRDLAIGVSKGFGLPTENVEKYLLMFVRWASPEWAELHENFWNENTKSNLSRESHRTIGAAISVLMDNRTEGVSDENKAEIARLYVSGGTGAVPTGIPTSVTYTNANGDEISVELKAKERKKYRKVWNQTVSGTIDELMSSEEFINADDEGKTKLIDKLYKYANQIAKNAVVPDKELDKWVEQGQNAINDGIPLSEYILFRVGLEDIDGTDKSGKTVNGLRAQRCMEYLESMGWDDEQEKNVYLDIVASETKATELNRLIESGLKWDQANDIAVSTKSKPEKWKQITDMNAAQEVKAAAMMVYASDTEKGLIKTGLSYGIKMEWYTEVLNNADSDHNGSVDQKEAETYIRSMDLTFAEMTYLFQMVTDAKRGKNNPFYKNAAELFWYDAHEADEG